MKLSILFLLISSLGISAEQQEEQKALIPLCKNVAVYYPAKDKYELINSASKEDLIAALIQSVQKMEASSMQLTHEIEELRKPKPSPKPQAENETTPQPNGHPKPSPIPSPSPKPKS